MSIEVQNIFKTFDNHRALQGVSLKVASGELVALLGPSGSGKTTLLRIIAGLEAPDPDSGAVFFHNENVSTIHVARRNVGFVFQHYGLFRHMSVFENVAFGLRVRPRAQRPSKADINLKVRELLHLVQLDRLGERFPGQLSGGQRQRVALARALAVEPKVLLLDEPFGALDARVRADLRRWLRRLHDTMHVTSVFVTHDQEEALEVADRIAIMNDGRIEQYDTPENVYDRPATPFVYNFLGNVNLFHGRVHNGRVLIGDDQIIINADGVVGEHSTAEADAPNSVPSSADPDSSGHATAAPEDHKVTSELKGTPAPSATPAPASNGASVAYVRPHDVEILLTPSAEAATAAKIEHLSVGGPIVRVELRLRGGASVDAQLTRDEYRALQLKSGQEVFLKFKRAHVFSDDYSI